MKVEKEYRIKKEYKIIEASTDTQFTDDLLRAENEEFYLIENTFTITFIKSSGYNERIYYGLTVKETRYYG